MSGRMWWVCRLKSGVWEIVVGVSNKVWFGGDVVCLSIKVWSVGECGVCVCVFDILENVVCVSNGVWCLEECGGCVCVSNGVWCLRECGMFMQWSLMCWRMCWMCLCVWCLGECSVCVCLCVWWSLRSERMWRVCLCVWWSLMSERMW